MTEPTVTAAIAAALLTGQGNVPKGGAQVDAMHMSLQWQVCFWHLRWS